MSEWIEWGSGNHRPPVIEGLRCDIKFRDGVIFENENSDDWWREWSWEDGSDGHEDIVAYRLSKANGEN